MNIAAASFAFKKLSIFTLVMIVFFSYTSFSQDEEFENVNEDPLSKYLRVNNVYQGTDFAEAIASGRRGFRNENYEYARKKFRIAQALSSNHPVPYFFEAHCYFAEGDYFAAYDSLVQGFKFLPEWVRLNFDLAEEYRFDTELKRHKTAILDETSANPSFKNWFVLGYVLYYTGEPERSVVAFKEVLRILNENKEVNLASKISQQFLIFLYDRGFVGKPVDENRQNEIKGWLRRAILHLNAEEYEKAVVVCGEEGMKFRNAKALFWMSMFLIADNSFDYAFSMLMRASETDATKIAEIPSINDVFNSDTLLKIKKSAQSIRNKILVGLFEGNQYMVLETLKSEDSKHFEQSEIDAIYRVLKNRNEIPKMPTIDGNTQPEIKTDNNTIEKKADDDNKPVNPDESGKDIDLEELKKAEEFLKKELGKKIEDALEFGKILFDEGKYSTAIEQFKLVLNYGSQISDDYFKNPENARVYVDLAKACFFDDKFAEASTNLQSFLKVSNGLIKADGTVFFSKLGNDSFDEKYNKLDIYCTINEKAYEAMFLKAYIDYFQNKLQSAVDLFSELHLNISDELAGWYLKTLESKGVKPTTSPRIKAKTHFLKAEKFLKGKVYNAALIEYKRAYNNLDEKDNLQALTGIVASIMHHATIAISIDDRMNYYATASDYIRKYLEKIGVDNWKNFTLNLSSKFPDKKQYEEALKVLDNHPSKKPLDFDAYYLHAFVLYFAKEYKKALEAFEKYEKGNNRIDTKDGYYYFMAVCENK